MSSNMNSDSRDTLQKTWEAAFGDSKTPNRSDFSTVAWYSALRNAATSALAAFAARASRLGKPHFVAAILDHPRNYGMNC
jgi:hypothetical protein